MARSGFCWLENEVSSTDQLSCHLLRPDKRQSRDILLAVHKSNWETRGPSTTNTEPRAQLKSTNELSCTVELPELCALRVENNGGENPAMEEIPS